MHERDRERTRAREVADDLDVDLAPGRATRSHALMAPVVPIVSGIVQRRARDGNGVSDHADAAIAAAGGGGHALPELLQRKFEASLGTELSSVRVHTDTASAVAANAVGARAFALGQHVHFGEGQYDPSSRDGEHLIAHEVAHTVQQRGGVVRQNKLEVSQPLDAAELEADRAADAMLSGAPAVITGIATAIHRNAGTPNATKLDPPFDPTPSGPIYASALLAACPSLPRRTSNPAFGQLAKDFSAYDFTKKHFDSEVAKLGPLLGYHPDITKTLAAVKAAAAPGTNLSRDGMLLNDRRFALKQIAKGLVTQYGTMNEDAVTYSEKSKILGAQKQLLAKRLDDLKDKQQAETQLKALSTTVGTLLGDVASLTGVLLGVGNLFASEGFKIGTSVLLKDPQMNNGGAARTAAADIAGQGTANLGGFVGAVIDKISGVAKEREDLNKLIAKLQEQLVQDQIAFDFVGILGTMTDMDALERKMKSTFVSMQSGAADYDAQLAAVRQAQGQRDATIDNITKGKLGEIQAKIVDCTHIDSAAGALIGGSILPPLSPPSAPALQTSLQAAAALAGSSGPKPADRDPFAAPDDPVPATLAAETSRLSGQVDVTMGSARDAQQHAQDKLPELTALADSLRTAADVSDPRLP